MEEQYTEPVLKVYTNHMTPKLEELLAFAGSAEQAVICGYRDEQVYFIAYQTVESVFAQQQKVYVRTQEGVMYTVKKRLYEMEDILPRSFVRISGSEIVNSKAIWHLDMSMAGSIKMVFHSGYTAFVSRRFLKAVRQTLQL